MSASPNPLEGAVRVGRHTVIVPFREMPAYRVGDIGVYRVRKMLQEDGAYVLSTCDISGPFSEVAPALEGAERRVIVPDLDVSFGGNRPRMWAEVKTKSIASFTRKTKRLEHGIKLSHWLAYRRIEEITGAQVFLYIYQRDESIILGSPIKDLATPDFRPSSMVNKFSGQPEPHCFFPYDAFRLKASLPVDIDEPAIFSVQLKLRFEVRPGSEAVIKRRA